MTIRTWKQVDALAEVLSREFGSPPDVAVVLGSGLGTVAKMLTDCHTISTATLTEWPRSTVSGHGGQLHKGTIGTVPVLIQQGRVHLYEGYTPTEVVLPIRAAISWGVKTVVLTNAAGGIGEELIPGSLMRITDHLNLSGVNPLHGPNDDTRGPRFLDQSTLWDPTLGIALDSAAVSQKLPLHAGVYGCMPGPTYETPAEVRMLAKLGADAVGMSTVPEAIAAGHLGARVAGVSCITNRAAGLQGSILDHDDVKKQGAAAADHLARILKQFIANLGEKT